MPVSRKREIKEKQENKKHMNMSESKAGKILITVLCIGMVLGLAIAAIVGIIEYLG